MSIFFFNTDLYSNTHKVSLKDNNGKFYLSRIGKWSINLKREWFTRRTLCACCIVSFFSPFEKGSLFISFQQICIFFQTCLHLVTLPLVLFDTWIFQKRYIQRSLYQMKLYLRHNAVLFLWSYVTKIHCVSLWIWNKEISLL